MAKPTSQDPQDQTETDQDESQVTATPEEIDTAELSDAPEPEASDAVSDADSDSDADQADPAEASDDTDTDADRVEEVDDTPSDDVLSDVDDTEPEADDPSIEEILEEGEPVEDSEPSDTPAAAEPQMQRETVVERKGGFVPMLLGGVVAAGIGFGFAQFTGTDLMGGSSAFEDEMRSTMAAQADQIAALETALQEASDALGAMDLAPISNSVAAITDNLTRMQDGIAALQDQSAQFDSRLSAIEKDGLAGAVGPEAIAAYERELEELRGAIAGQRAAIETQKTEMLAIAEQVLAAERSAEEKAQLAAARNAVGAMVWALQNGQPYDAALAELQANGVDVPAALAEFAEDGVPSSTALLSEFPPLARKALRVARDAVSAEESGGISGFLTARLGARSVAPRDGDDVDAVLSRAEAAAKAGDLNTALVELQALPEEAGSVLADWVARATIRNQALSAAAALGEELNK